MKLIVIVDENWGIGIDGDQPYHIPEDQRFFREKTLGKAIVIGRVTLAAFPHGRPLKGRTNIVLTRSRLDTQGIITCASLPELAELLNGYNTDEVYVAGGQQIYEMLLEYCNTAYVTKIFATPHVDRYFPNLDEMPNWVLTSQSAPKCHDGIEFCFCEYENTAVRAMVESRD